MSTARNLLHTLLIFLVCAAGLSASEPTTDSLKTVKKNVDAKKAILVDVREPKEWDAGHLAVSVSLPLSELKTEIDSDLLAQKLPKDKIIYTFCVKGVRSLSAAEILQKLGYDVRSLKPGYQDLLDAGFEKSKK